ncbi:YolD-like family protein [Gracilibacillus sp. YIM 98692]|uniref:YolD-like family protein n=1 Tax=Gracilibacillus sp. YIM 98692 TaxID=2663532 RepID=UPI0013CFFE1C|nr:YolD-like family protein [Gracilibacillus sp. YIM 98692]
MRPNKLTPGSNLLWESSRMMLPEHKQVLQRHQKELNQKSKPTLDEQQMDLLSQMISDAMEQNCIVKVHLFHLYQDKYMIGKIQKTAPERGEIQLSSKNNSKWIHFGDILDISFPSNEEMNIDHP